MECINIQRNCKTSVNSCFVYLYMEDGFQFDSLSVFQAEVPLLCIIDLVYCPEQHFVFQTISMNKEGIPWDQMLLQFARFFITAGLLKTEIQEEQGEGGAFLFPAENQLLKQEPQNQYPVGLRIVITFISLFQTIAFSETKISNLLFKENQ